MGKGLSTFEVDLAPDLKEIRQDPSYLSLIAKLQPKLNRHEVFVLTE